ncbi:unnamed protein product [Zymoseptoria tritici ST99CH_3D1]|nr:unnamed protein product [Zymoseptoria tritici ST99CH_3D1]
MASSGRADREARARFTITRAIPELLRNSPKARSGVSQSDLVVDPPISTTTTINHTTPIIRPDLKIRISTGDTLQAASRCSSRPYASKRNSNANRIDDSRPNVTVHNMASLKTPGGGFMTGGNGQEEFLCARTTLHSSLHPSLYPLPEVGAIYTPDVLVFRDTNAIDLPRRDRFFVNVISAGLPKHPDPNRLRALDREPECSCGVSYCDAHRDLVLRKMKAILRIADSKSCHTLVLGAWGAGSLNHPVQEVARLWRRVLVGSPRQRRPNAEQFPSIKEIIFSIPHSSFAREFRRIFDDVLAPESPISSPPSLQTDTSSPQSIRQAARHDAELQRNFAKAASLELQIEQASSAYVRGRLKEDLRAVNHSLALGRAAKASLTSLDEDEDFDEDLDEDLEDDYVVSGYIGSDGEEQGFYCVDGGATTTTSEEEDGGGSSEGGERNYEFKFGSGTTDTVYEEDEDEDDELDFIDGVGRGRSGSSAWTGVGSGGVQNFDPSTGWFRGSIDQLMNAHVSKMGPRRGSDAQGGGFVGDADASLGSPILVAERGEGIELMEEEMLERLRGVGMVGG